MLQHSGSVQSGEGVCVRGGGCESTGGVTISESLDVSGTANATALVVTADTTPVAHMFPSELVLHP